MNKDLFERLSSDLQQVVTAAAMAEHGATLADVSARNARALRTLVWGHGVQVRELPASMLTMLGNAAGAVLRELKEGADALTGRIMVSYLEARLPPGPTSRSHLTVRALGYTYA